MIRKAMFFLLFSSLIILSVSYPNDSRKPMLQSVKPAVQVEKQYEGKVKVLLVTGEYAPYTSAKLSDHGFFTAKVETVLAEMGLEYEIRFYPWARCEEMVRSGQAWAAFPYGMSERTMESYLMSSPVSSSRHKYFYLKANSKFSDAKYKLRDISDFRDYVFGGANGYWYGTKEDLGRQRIERVVWADDVYGLVRLLYNKRIDVFIEDELVGWEVIKKIYPGEDKQFATLPTDAKAQQYHLLVSKMYPKSEELLVQFNAALDRIKKRGEL